jgi:hypothetical protein
MMLASADDLAAGDARALALAQHLAHTTKGVRGHIAHAGRVGGGEMATV